MRKNKIYLPPHFNLKIYKSKILKFLVKQMIHKKLMKILHQILRQNITVALILIFYSKRIHFKLKINNFLARKQIWLSIQI